jgi:acyl-CoA hydrolase
MDTAETRFVEMIFPEQTNHYGTLFGGNGLALMAKAAFVTATRRARRAVVMAASERVDFDVPVRLGEILDLVARVERIGRTSMTVSVTATAEELKTGVRRPAMAGRFEMVAVDDDGRPTAIA